MTDAQAKSLGLENIRRRLTFPCDKVWFLAMTITSTPVTLRVTKMKPGARIRPFFFVEEVEQTLHSFHHDDSLTYET